MKSLGEYLQAERLARGISLEQISADTKITMSMLRAIEEGDIGELPAPVFTKGFLRAYAERIGLDPDAVIVEYQDLIENADARQETMEKFHQRLRPEPSRKKLLALWLALPLLVALTLLLWRSKQFWQKSPSAKSGEPVAEIQESQATSEGDSVSVPYPLQSVRQSQQTVEAVQESRATSESDSVSAPYPVQSARQSEETHDPSTTDIGPEPVRPELNTQPPPASPTDEKVSPLQESSVYSEGHHRQPDGAEAPTPAPYVLKAMATETTWLRISIDEMQEREYLLQPGEQVTWRATTGYKLHIGNAAGLQLYLNDKPIKALGETGRVVHLELPDSSLWNSSASSRPTQ